VKGNGKPYPMNEWVIDNNTGPNSPGSVLKTFLKEWGEKVENQELSCLGVSFTPPESTKTQGVFVVIC
jgi:hypothetical protein